MAKNNANLLELYCSIENLLDQLDKNLDKASITALKKISSKLVETVRLAKQIQANQALEKQKSNKSS